MIRLEHREPVFVVTMDGGENRIDRPWLDGFNDALDRVDGAPDPVALVTTGTDRFFSNGLDLEWLLGAGPEAMRSFVVEVEALFARLIEAPYITVAACNGHTFAAGAMLALCHDIRVMRADRGFFCLPEVELGLPFTPGMDALIRSRLLVTTAHEAMVTGKRFGGVEAAEKGIVAEAPAAEGVMPRAIELATEHAGKTRSNLRAIKQRMYFDVLGLLRSSEGIAGP